jgi:3-hydroxyacyl-CoA dehydrogenase
MPVWILLKPSGLNAGIVHKNLMQNKNMSNEITTPNRAPLSFSSKRIDTDELKRDGKIFRENAGASIIDIGDRIGLVEFHTKANALNDEVCEMIMVACGDGSNHFDAVVIGNRGKHFSAGANLSYVLDAARTGKWTDLERTIRALQSANMAIKCGPLPVVAAPFSNALGGGCEVCLHSARVVIADGTQMGLVEAGLGLVPAGGGTKELGIRAQALGASQGLTDPLDAIQKAFEIIVHAKVSSTGTEAKQLFLAVTDTVVPSQEGPIEVAKQAALELVGSGYHNSVMQTNIPVIGAKGIFAFQSRIDEMRGAKLISDHDSIIAMHVATILCGGAQPAGTASEQHFLDLEREAFLSLLGTERTQARIEFLLMNKKPLRN